MTNIEQLKIFDRKILRRPVAENSESKGTMILLHGYGADEYDLMGLAPYFSANLQIISIRGPGSTMYGGASWFDIDMLADGGLIFNLDQALDSTNKLLQLIPEMQDQGIISDAKIILAGFSQGATIANLITLMKPELVKALLIMSGRLDERASELIKDSTAFVDLPVFAGHGINDNVIPVEFGRQIVSFWRKLPVLLEHYEYPIGHEICQEELGHIQVWLDKL
ncbi:hypothetical protein HQ531_09940 [bacterium]|nr:hypothetical protein [bacterium]